MSSRGVALHLSPLVLLLLLLAGAGCGGPVPGREPPEAVSSPPRESPRARPVGSPFEGLLQRVAVVEDAPYHPGYDRACGPGACVFGRPWTDDHPGRFGHNGCDTRQDVLLQQMRDIELRWGSHCRIYQAKLTDPYTGKRLTWRADGSAIEIDHVYSLSRAWHGGAWAWTQRRRLRFANDVRRELIATSRQANQAKRDGTPAEWLPQRPRQACRYAAAYVRVAIAYGLPITRADAAAIRALPCTNTR